MGDKYVLHDGNHIVAAIPVEAITPAVAVRGDGGLVGLHLRGEPLKEFPCARFSALARVDCHDDFEAGHCFWEDEWVGGVDGMADEWRYCFVGGGNGGGG